MHTLPSAPPPRRETDDCPFWVSDLTQELRTRPRAAGEVDVLLRFLVRRSVSLFGTYTYSVHVTGTLRVFGNTDDSKPAQVGPKTRGFATPGRALTFQLRHGRLCIYDDGRDKELRVNTLRTTSCPARQMSEYAECVNATETVRCVNYSTI